MPDFTSGHYLIKICGVTSLADATDVIEAGATALGLVLAESPRQLSLDRASEVAEATTGQITRVAVFRDQSERFVLNAVETLKVEAAQIHGPLSTALVTDLHARGVAVIQALAKPIVDTTTRYEALVDAILADGPTPGSGEFHGFEGRDQAHFSRPLIAAGGLTPGNVAEVIEATGAWGVDVSSGVESSPGKKDRALVRDFVERARERFEHREELRD